MSSLRTAIEQASLPAVRTLSTLPRAVPFLLVLVLLVAGIFVPYGYVLILLVAAFLGWLLFLAWPRLTATERLMRATVGFLALAIGITEAFPRG